MLSKPLSALCAVALISAPHFSTAATFTVNDPAEFQTALTTAQSNGENDTINVAGGTYNVAPGGTLTYTAAANENFGLVIVGDSMAPTVLDGGSLVPILRIDSTAVINDGGVSFEIMTLTFQNGNASTAPNDDGGALTILTDESQQPAEFATIVMLSDLDFLSCAAADDGGALYIRAHAVEGIYLSNILFDTNQAGGDGGSAYVAGGLFTTPQFYDDIFFFDGMAQGSGGGLVAEGFDAATPSEDLANSVSLFDVTFYNNVSMSATEGGGGADISSLAIFIDTVGFVDNRALDGAGLRVRPSWSSIAMVNTGFVGNVASRDGGGFAALDSMFQTFTMTNNTVFDNAAAGRGGGVLLLIDGSATIAEIHNNIIYSNSAAPDAGDDLFVDNNVFGDIGAGTALFHNDITDFVIGPIAVVAGSNIDEAPLFVDMITRPEPDPRLLAGSPGIDVANDNAPGRPTRDFEGDSRPFDGDGDMTATTDMGMDEFTGVVVQNADLAVTKSDSPDPVVEGQSLTYTIVVTNNGPGDANNVTLTDPLDQLVTFVSATPTQGTCAENMGTVTCSLVSIANGATATVTIVVTAPTPAGQQQISNTASVSGSEPDPVTGNDSATELTTVVPAGPATADLSVTKSDSPDPVLSDGSTLTYTIAVTNNGPDDATGVTMSDTLPGGVAFQSVSTNTGQCDAQPDGNGVLNCTIGNLAVNNTATVTLVVAPDEVAEPSTITNTAVVSGTEVDPTAANNTATEDTTVNPPASDMQVAISATPGSPLIENQVVYTLNVSNGGPSDNTNVVLTVVLPAMATFDGVTSEQGNCNVVKDTVTCTIGDLAAGESVVVTITVTAPDTPMTLTLTATVAGDVADPQPPNNSDSIDVSVIDTVDLTIEGTSDGTGSFGWAELALLVVATAMVLAARRRQAVVAAAFVVAAIGLLQPGVASAQDDWYVSANVGSLSLDYDAADLTSDLASRGWTITDVTVDDSGTAWKIVGGFNVSEYFAVEAGFVDLGDVTTRYSTTIPPTEIDNILSDTFDVHPLQGDGWVTSAVVRWPIQDSFAFTARAGLFFWESDLDVRVVTGGTGSVSGTESGTDAMYGIGLEWQLSDKWSVTADYERYQLNEWIDVPFVGVKFTF
ncbi:MAG: outer membrane beta-barrel protein [Woeseiaceae bacterium]|nr:outer membrane beta-barrel protein [Woeseiaceae bacterium]